MSTRYYVIDEAIPLWVKPIDREYANQLQNYRWDETPLSNDLPPLDCYLSQNKRLPDILTVHGGAISLYSRRLLEILSAHHVQFDTIRANLYDEKTDKLLYWDYEMFHLLTYMDGFDKENSANVPNRRSLDKLVLTEECKNSSIPMMRLRNKLTITLMAEPLVKSIQSAKISKFRFLAVDEYSYENWSATLKD